MLRAWRGEVHELCEVATFRANAFKSSPVMKPKSPVLPGQLLPTSIQAGNW